MSIGMMEFTVFVKNEAGNLADILNVLGKYAVNISSIVSEGTRNDGPVKIVTDDVETAKRALEELGIPFETKEVILVRVLNQPGELGNVAKMLGDVDINIEAVYRLGNGRYAIRVNKMEYAKQILGERLL